MPNNKKKKKGKGQLHPRNKHQGRYDLTALSTTYPVLGEFIVPNKYGDESINFAKPEAVKALNKALLLHHYELKDWDIPEGFLCPPIPGRADYIHHIADGLARYNDGKVPTGKAVKCLDIGVGANCIYPIIGHQEYGWSFIASDIDEVSLAAAKKNIDDNPPLQEVVEFRHQSDQFKVFENVLGEEEVIDLCICNPPFHTSMASAKMGTLRKWSNLKLDDVEEDTLNFGGQEKELWCLGGEKRFIGDMIRESKNYANRCFWFSSVVSRYEHLDGLFSLLEKMKVPNVRAIPMGQGNKVSRILAWSFLSTKQQETWKETRWDKK